MRIGWAKLEEGTLASGFSRTGGSQVKWKLGWGGIRHEERFGRGRYGEKEERERVMRGTEQREWRTM